VDRVVVDIYNDGEVVVLVVVGEKTIVLECGGGSPNDKVSDPAHQSYEHD
jgi:hypothetical protein